MARSALLNVMVNAAIKAGKSLTKDFAEVENLQVSRKGPADFVSKADLRAEQIVFGELQKARPTYAFLMEEGGEVAGTDGQHRWIIDPLDGTTNFIHGFPQYAVSIALQYRGQITQAVVYDPTRNELFTASKGAGAFLNEKRLRVAKRDKLADALLGTGFPYSDLSALDEYVKMFHLMTQKSAGLRRPGAAALDLAYVAAGRLDGFFEKNLKPWDIAAGALLITEAGGIVANFSGESDYLYKGDVIAGSPKVFGQMLNLLSPFA